MRYFRLDFLRDSGDSGCGWSRRYARRRAMFSAVMHDPPWPGVRAHVVFLQGIHLPQRSLPGALSFADITLHPLGPSEPVR